MHNKEIELLPLLRKFITESENGKRLKKDGKRLKPGTIVNYECLYKNLEEFILLKSFDFRLRPFDKLDQRQRETERNYWKKFYRKFTEFLYINKKCYDSYVGTSIKIIKVFFNYINTEKLISTGNYFKNFYAIKEEVPVITLSQEQLHFLIFDTEFKNLLPPHLKTTRNIFIVGCTVALRFSDLFGLCRKNIEFSGGAYYLNNISQKTQTNTRVKLPNYVVEIINQFLKAKAYQNKNSNTPIFPKMSLSQFNINLKLISEYAGWTNTVGKVRSRRGKSSEKYLLHGKTIYRFCDLVSSYVMRRTAVTTMLILGMPEHLVRKVSGHSNNSSAFYRYVNYAQSFVDNEIDKVHHKIEFNSAIPTNSRIQNDFLN